MQFELTKHCLAFTPRYSDGNTNCYSKQYKGRYNATTEQNFKPG